MPPLTGTMPWRGIVVAMGTRVGTRRRLNTCSGFGLAPACLLTLRRVGPRTLALQHRRLRLPRNLHRRVPGSLCNVRERAKGEAAPVLLPPPPDTHTSIHPCVSLAQPPTHCVDWAACMRVGPTCRAVYARARAGRHTCSSSNTCTRPAADSFSRHTGCQPLLSLLPCACARACACHERP